MKETTIGQLRLVSDDGRLKVSSVDGFDKPVALSSDEVSELLVFLVSLSATDFNQRQSYRIPLWNGINLSVMLSDGESSTASSPVNLSHTGMLVELPEQDSSGFQPKEFVEVHIDFEGKSAKIPAKIERKDGLRWGLNFTGSDSGDTNPFPDYADIVMAIQQRWAARFRTA